MRRQLRHAVGTSRLVVALLGIAALAAVVVTPLGAQGVTARLTIPPPLYSVGITRCTFVDHSRGLLNYQRTPYRLISKSRTLLSEIRYPTALRTGGAAQIPGATPVVQSGGYPTVIFAHGYDVTPDTYAALLDAWVEAGFVVVAPVFPDENSNEVAAQGGTNTEDDIVNEPGDLAFVTTSVIQASANETTTCPLLSGLVNPSELALAGHSDGAEAVGMLAYDHGLDPQGNNFASLRAGLDYRAVLILSGALDTYQANADEASKPDLLVIQSLADQCNPFSHGVQFYNAIHQTNKWFLVLRSAHHLPPFDGADPSAFVLVVKTTVPFLEMALEDKVLAPSLVAIGSEEPSIGVTYAGSPGPLATSAPRIKESCGPN